LSKSNLLLVSGCEDYVDWYVLSNLFRFTRPNVAIHLNLQVGSHPILHLKRIGCGGDVCCVPLVMGWVIFDSEGAIFWDLV
jgi:hypothetical protein